MQKLAIQMATYYEHHTKLVTRLTHFVGVPLIIFSLFLILIQYFPLYVAIISFSALCLYYLYLNVGLGIFTSVTLLGILALAVKTQQHFTQHVLPIAVFFFILGWVLQLVGHWYEKKRPAFMNNLGQVFIAPIFLMAELLFCFGYMTSLQKEVMKLNKIDG